MTTDANLVGKGNLSQNVEQSVSNPDSTVNSALQTATQTPPTVEQWQNSLLTSLLTDQKAKASLFELLNTLSYQNQCTNFTPLIQEVFSGLITSQAAKLEDATRQQHLNHIKDLLTLLARLNSNFDVFDAHTQYVNGSIDCNYEY